MAPKLTDTPVRTEERVYKTTPQGELKLHFFLPADSKPEDHRPVIVFFFGGGWKNGNYTQFQSQSEYFASRGLVAASADYRISSVHKTTPAECVADAKSAIRWVRAHAKEFGVDPDKVIASGGSAGGHLAAAAALVPGFDEATDDMKVSCVPNAMVLFNPALNLSQAPTPIKDAKGNNISKEISPTVYLTKSAPPSVIFFGTADRLGAMGTEYAARAKELGVRADLYLAPDMPHGFFNRAPWTQVTAKKADEWLASQGYLSGPPAVKVPEGAPALTQ
jgi:acetyl esterase/lipase